MGYNIDLKQLSTKDYGVYLAEKQMYQTRKILHEDTRIRFSIFVEEGLESVDALRKAISTPAKIAALSEKTGIPADFLNILRREIGSITPKKVPIRDFPNVDASVIDKLYTAGIKSSKDVFDKLTPEKAGELGVDAKAFADLYVLSDLVRINGMGAVAARIFADAGYKSVDDVANGDAQSMFDATTTVNDDKLYYKGVLTVKDMQFCIDFANTFIRFTE